MGISTTFTGSALEDIADLCQLSETGPEHVTLLFGRRTAFQKDITEQRSWVLSGAKTGLAKLKQELVRSRGQDLVVLRAPRQSVP